MSDTIVRKACSFCHKEKLLNDDNYHRDASNLDGFRDMCKDCRQQEDESHFLSQVQNQVAAIDRSALVLLQKITEEGATSTALPHAATLLEDIMTIWGGSRGFAQHMLAEYLRAAPGSQTRLRYMQLIVGMVKFVSQENYVSPPLQSLDDDKLEELKRQQELQILKKLGLESPEYEYVEEEDS